jgi:phosphatidylserine/phosphatidylglycerophosphate/cardiolipin synthase-like enzyme
VENRELAGIFADYIEKDRKASEMEAPEEAPVPVGEPPYPSDDEFVLEFRVPSSPLSAEEEAARLPRRIFAPLTLAAGAPVEAQPILTPDNYAEYALELIGRARRRLWFQNQSLVIGATVAPKYRELLDALKRKSWEIDDARIIVRDLIRATTLDVLRMLDREGFPMEKVRVMKTCHTKGILVDSRWTLVGSHNWTNEGTLYNRDASLLIDSAEVTQYFEDVLDHDWTYLAESLRVDSGRPSAILPLPGETVEGARLVVDPRLDRAAE